MRVHVQPPAFVVAVLAAGISSSCSLLPSRQEERIARDFLGCVARGEPLQPDRVDSSLRTAEAVARLAILHDQLQGVDAALAEQVSRAWMREPDGRTALVFDFKVTARGGPSIARVVLLRTSPRAPPVLFGIHLLRLSELRPPGRRRIGALLILSALVVVPIVIIISLARLWRAPAGRKWGWALFILIGVGKLMVNWSSGQIEVKILSIQILGGSILRSPAGDWFFAVSLPLGAIIYLLIPPKKQAPVPFDRNLPLNR